MTPQIENTSHPIGIEIASFKPSAYYFRAALRDARSLCEAIAVGLHAVRELENLADQLYEAGISPSHRFIMSSEAEEKNITHQPYRQNLQPSAEESSASPLRAVPVSHALQT